MTVAWRREALPTVAVVAVRVGVKQPHSLWGPWRGWSAWLGSAEKARARRRGGGSEGRRLVCGRSWRGLPALGGLLLGFGVPGLGDFYRGRHELGAASGTQGPCSRGYHGGIV